MTTLGSDQDTILENVSLKSLGVDVNGQIDGIAQGQRALSLVESA